MPDQPCLGTSLAISARLICQRLASRSWVSPEGRKSSIKPCPPMAARAIRHARTRRHRRTPRGATAAPRRAARFGPRWRVALRHHDGGTMRTWGGRFSGDTDARVADFTRSIEVDAALAADDIAGSIAHVRGLGRAGLLTDDEVGSLTDGLLALARDAAAGTLDWDPALEDVHMNVEAALVREDRAPGGTAPHRAFAQRPGRDGPAPLDASGDRRPRPRTARVRARPGRALPNATAPRSCPARPTSSRPSRSCSHTTCWRMSRWPSAIGAAWPTRACGSTSRRSGPARWPGRATRSTARRRRASSGSMA